MSRRGPTPVTSQSGPARPSGARGRTERTAVAGARGAARPAVAPARAVSARRSAEPAPPNDLSRHAPGVPGSGPGPVHLYRLRSPRIGHVQAHRGDGPVAIEPPRCPGASPRTRRDPQPDLGLAGDRPTSRTGAAERSAGEPSDPGSGRGAVRDPVLTASLRESRSERVPPPGSEVARYDDRVQVDIPGALFSARIL